MIGHRVLRFDSIESTNTHALDLADDPANDGVVVLANQQTAGRGQHGRRWLSPPGSGILMSLVVFPPPALRKAPLLTAWATVSVCDVILAVTGLQAKMKWPNDVLVGGKKVCGILIEQRTVASCRTPATVLGIGLNLHHSAAAFADAGLPDAGSLAMLTERALDRDEIAQRLIRQLDDYYEQMRRGDLAALEACWTRRIGLRGREVVAQTAGGDYRGRLRALDFDGAHIDKPDGQTVIVSPETIHHLRAIDE
jgi:BirA family biotin operon repressor/biotin-[acetyl-CoA-carboxylase] ligase